MYVKRLHLKEFIKPSENANIFPEMPNAFKVCCLCEDASLSSSLFYQSLQKLETSDRRAALNGIAKLLKIANKGELLRRHYDEKQLHDIHTFEYKGQQYTILRIRTSDTRLLFFYAQDRMILLTDVFAKRADKVTAQQKKMAENMAKQFIDAGEKLVFEE